MKSILYTCLLISQLLFISSCGEDVIHGCIDSQACNFNPEATNDNGSCNYPVLGYDCYGNNAEFYVGQKFNSGIVFFIDSTGEHGLIAAMEDLPGTDDTDIPGTYEWGCYEETVNGADGTEIGAGLQNTLDIVSGCSDIPIAASEALSYESNGYSDWYLPSKDELYEMYNTIGNGGPEGNIGRFNNSWGIYWSSSEFGNSGSAWNVDFIGSGPRWDSKWVTFRVRVIRAF